MNPAAELPLPQRVFQRLDASEFRSGERLAAELEVTRAAVWKAVEQLRELGVALDAQTHKGYRLARGVSALDADRIRELLPGPVLSSIEALLVEWALESTNTRLLDSLPPAAGSAAVVLAEYQAGGRGRRGRTWIAPPGGAICLSIAWQYPDMPADLSALSLFEGMAAVAALRDLGVEGVRLKWPNDLVTPTGKLGGILIEMRAEAGGPVHVVVGLGLNVRLDETVRASIATTGNVADDLCSRCPTVPNRNAVVAALLQRLVPAFEEFARYGLAPRLADWHAVDALQDREITIENMGEVSRGIARGIDVHGALLVETPGGVRRFVSGEVSVRVDR